MLAESETPLSKLDSPASLSRAIVSHLLGDETPAFKLTRQRIRARPCKLIAFCIRPSTNGGGGSTVRQSSLTGLLLLRSGRAEGHPATLCGCL
jgi:hypothetical protein